MKMSITKHNQIIAKTAVNCYIKTMTDIAKFNADVQRIMKHDRQDHNGKSDWMRVAPQLQNLFNRSTSCPTTLSTSVFEYWENQYIHDSAEMENEPTEAHMGKLRAMLSFLENTDEEYELLDDNDWQELGDLVNYEADDLPIDILQNLMSVLVSKSAY